MESKNINPWKQWQHIFQHCQLPLSHSYIQIPNIPKHEPSQYSRYGNECLAQLDAPALFLVYVESEQNTCAGRHLSHLHSVSGGCSLFYSMLKLKLEDPLTISPPRKNNTWQIQPGTLWSSIFQITPANYRHRHY